MIFEKYFTRIKSSLVTSINRLVDIEVLSLFPPSIFNKGINNLNKYDGNTLNYNTCNKYVTIPLTRWYAPKENLAEQIKVSSFTLSIPDGKTFGGTLRGWGAVDLQVSREDKSQVAGGNYSFISGKNNKAVGIGSVSIGISNTVADDYSCAIGYNNSGANERSILLGSNNTATAPIAYVIGDSNSVTGQGGTAIGNNNVASSSEAVSIGSDNIANSVYAMTIGKGNNVQGYQSLAIGADNTSINKNSYVVGNNNSINGASVCVGADNTLTNTYTVSVGNNHEVNGAIHTTNIGLNNKPITNKSSTFGFGTREEEVVAFEYGADYIALVGSTGDASTEVTLKVDATLVSTYSNDIWLEPISDKTIDFTVIGRDLNSTASISFSGKVFAYADGDGVVTIVGTPLITKEFFSQALETCNVSVSLASPAIHFKVTGVANTDIAWYLMAKTVQSTMRFLNP